MIDDITREDEDVQGSLTTLRDWILARNSEGANLTLETDIIDGRWIDSLQFVAFLLVIEEMRGKEIPAHEMKLDSFRTLAAIQRHFLRRPS